MRIPWKRLAQALVLILALGFLAALVRSQWSALHSYRWRLAPGWALLALAGLELTWLFELDTWRTILASLGGRLGYRRAAQVWFLSNIIRYIPGNVWQFLGMAEMAAEDGVPRLATFSSIVLHQAISTAAGLVLAALYFAVAGQGVWFHWLRPFLLAVPLGLVLLQPRILERVLNGVLVRLRRQPLVVTLTWGQVWVLLLRYCIVWLGMGLSYSALVRALTPVQPGGLPYLVASWAAAYVIGYLSLLTPSGIGVREGVMVVLLAAIMPEPVAAVIAIVARLWMIAGEVVGAGVSLASIRWAGQRSRTHSGVAPEKANGPVDETAG
jgi:glycosyltransferase 2 family protein